MDEFDLNLKKVRFIVKGLVQGVGYRYFVMKHAHRLHLFGYAKNLFDGNVEVVVEGNLDSINQLHKLLEQGPSRANVSYCLYEELEYLGDYKEFYIL